jgi:hypothetical protein
MKGRAMQLLLSLKRTFIRLEFIPMRRMIRGMIMTWMLLQTMFYGGLSGQVDQIRINEFMALNGTTLMDEDGEFSDWIELFNPGSGDVQLLGWSLTDDPLLPQKWTLPDVTMAAKGYLVIFASGKDRAIAGSELHSSFKLSGNGEYLALRNDVGEVVSEFNPAYPLQQPDISFGYLDGTYIPFTEPTPGSDNQPGGAVLPAPIFSVEHGIFETPIQVEITCEVPGAVIYYTTNGSTPGPGKGQLYVSALQIDSTSILRAVALLDAQTVSATVTCTYLFLEDVIRQPNDPEGYPAEWGPYTAIEGMAIADYEMDPELMADSAFAETILEGLKSIPTMSLVTDVGYLFSHSTDPDTGGIYIYTGPPLDRVVDGLGKGWERPASIEYFDPQGSESFQVNCGVRIQGGHARRPEKSPKHSFRLVFRSEYGPSKLNFPLFNDEKAVTSFNTLILRAGFGLSWVHHSHYERQQAQYQRDIWAKDTQRAMGHPSSRSEYVHLYINGIYWGVYAPSERIDSDFGASYLEGNPEDFDVVKDYQDVIDGEITAWNNLFAQANAGLETDEAYQRIQGNRPDGTPDPSIEAMVDVVNLADYMLIHFYGSNTDWDHHNWAAMRNRNNPGKGFKFLSWDSEHLLKSVYGNELGENNDLCPSRIFQQLILNEEYKRVFADRVQRYCFDGGLLTPGSAAERWTFRTNQVEPAIPVESARWGDYRRDVHQFQPGGPFDLYGYENYWLPQHSFMMDTYFPERTDIFIDQLRSAGLFPLIDAPLLRVNGLPIMEGSTAKGDLLSMSSPEGVIYYTLNGADPADWGSGGKGESVLIASEDSKYVLVPREAISDSWQSDPAFSHEGWMVCSGLPGGIGYEKGTGYEQLITLDVADGMYNSGVDPNTSCFIRIPFTVEPGELDASNNLYLKIRYDDGFAVFLNGTRVAEANAPLSLSWNSASTGTHEALAPELFNLSDHMGLLKEGDNLLAIQVLNSEVTSSDFILTVEMMASEGNTTGISTEAVVYTGPFPVEQSVHVMARTYLDGGWSALTNRFITFYEDFGDLRITEIHYHPLEGDTVNDSEFEFIELKNTGASTLDLGGVRFLDGIDFEFPPETQLGEGEFVVLASNSLQFYDRYGFMPSGEYSGNLDNNGEWIVLGAPGGDTLTALEYGDAYPWPILADGTGNSMVPVELNPGKDQNLPAGWRDSYHIGGSPGRDDTEATFTEERAPELPAYNLGQNYPNPFSDITYISYVLPGHAYVELSVYNLMGQKVDVLVSSQQSAGSYLVSWSGSDGAGYGVKEGIYFYRMIIRDMNGEHVFSRKMIKY